MEGNKLSMFLEHHQEEAQKELDAYGYLMKQAIEHIANGEFKKAAVYHENITRSLNELQQLRNRKETHDEMWLKWKQIQSEQAGETIRRNFF